MPDSRFFDTQPNSAGALAELVGAELIGDAALHITHAAPLHVAGSGAISFLDNKHYVKVLGESQASACILAPAYQEKAPEGMTLLLCDAPYVAYAKIAAHLHPKPALAASIHPNAVIDETAEIGANVHIGANTVIGAHVKIGEGAIIHPNATLYDAVTIGARTEIHSQTCISHSDIGADCIIHRGSMIGQDGFGYATEHGRHIPVPQLGRVVIEDDVHIGANCTIDRGAGPDTRIGAGTKMDNLVQIGHNVEIGKGCIIVSHVGISGSAKLGNYCVIGGQVGIAGHLNIGNQVQVAAQSGVMRDLPDGAVHGGSPSVPIKQFHRQSIALAKLVKGKV